MSKCRELNEDSFLSNICTFLNGCLLVILAGVLIACLLITYAEIRNNIENKYKKEREQSKIQYLIGTEQFRKKVEEHNKNNVLHKVSIETITSEEINAIFNPCTVWDYREKEKCSGQIRLPSPLCITINS